MRRRFLVVSITLAVSAAGVAACTGDDNAAPGPVADAGVDTSVASKDAGADTNVADTSTTDSNVEDTSTSDTNVPDTSTTDAADASDAADAADAACNGILLTVTDVDDWCTVTIGSGTPFSSGAQTVCVAADDTINLSAIANNGFALGPWHHTNGDTNDAGDDGNIVDAGGTPESLATILTPLSGTACVWICCPGSGLPCPTTFAGCP